MPWPPLDRVSRRYLKVYDALGRAGWFAFLSQWHAYLLATVMTSEVDEPLLPMSTWGDVDPVGTTAEDAADRYAEWCDLHDLDPTRAAHGVVALERLGILVRGRFLLVFRRFALANPVPLAATHPELDDEARAAAAVAADHFAIASAVEEALASAGGRAEAPTLDDLAERFDTDADTLEDLADDGGYGLDLEAVAGGGVALVLVDDDEVDGVEADV